MSEGAAREDQAQQTERSEPVVIGSGGGRRPPKWSPPPITPEELAKLTPQERARRNLRPPWKKGETGNPSGRNRRTLRELVIAELSTTNKNEPMHVARAIAEKVKQGDSTIIKAIMDREWPVVQAHLIGKATEEQTRQMAPPDMSRLSQEERDTMSRLARKLIMPAAIDVAGERIDDQDDDEHEAADEGVGAA